MCSWCWLIACWDLVGVFAVGGTGRELGDDPGVGYAGGMFIYYNNYKCLI